MAIVSLSKSANKCFEVKVVAKSHYVALSSVHYLIKWPTFTILVGCLLKSVSK